MISTNTLPNLVLKKSNYKINNFTDINECESPELNNCGANSGCEDLPGSFVCRCGKGFIGHCDECTGT